jgi:hypothetical protein
MIKIQQAKIDRLNQGDIIREVPFIESVIESDDVIRIEKIIFPYVIVLSQDCDLREDFQINEDKKETQDKKLLSILVAPIYNADHVFAGEHLSEIGIKSNPINRLKTEGIYLLSNQRSRYHYIEFPDEIPLVPSIIDFKHYFSISSHFLINLKKENYVCTISELFREDITIRFANFLARIGLPPF